MRNEYVNRSCRLFSVQSRALNRLPIPAPITGPCSDQVKSAMLRELGRVGGVEWDGEGPGTDGSVVRPAKGWAGFRHLGWILTTCSWSSRSQSRLLGFALPRFSGTDLSTPIRLATALPQGRGIKSPPMLHFSHIQPGLHIGQPYWRKMNLRNICQKNWICHLVKCELRNMCCQNHVYFLPDCTHLFCSHSQHSTFWCKLVLDIERSPSNVAILIECSPSLLSAMVYKKRSS